MVLVAEARVIPGSLCDSVNELLFLGVSTSRAIRATLGTSGSIALE